MANVLLNPTIITKETLRVLENSLVMAKNVNRMFEPQFKGKIGSTLTVRKPNRYTVRSGATLSAVDLAEPSTVITVGTQIGVDMNFTSVDLALTIDDFSDRYLKKAAAALANKIDLDLCALYSDVYNHVGTPGTTPSTFADLMRPVQRLDEEAVPRDGNRTGVVNPAANASLADGLKGIFNPQSAIGDVVRKGLLGTFADIDWMLDQNVASHTVGAYGGTPLINGASQTGSVIITDGWTATTGQLVKGDVITFAGCFAVNPQSRVSTGVLREFVVTATTTADGSGNMATLPVSPPLITSGPYQTCNASPADNATITVKTGTASTAYPQNLVFHQDAFTLVTVPLELPKGVHFADRQTYKGISMRVVQAYDITNDKFPLRFDILYGVKTLYPELACRMTG